jgi:predicted O-linked N-acetylglucosamine transferase (SPINDLY family)
MDYFISNDLFEIEDARDHYSEKLVLLRDLGTLAYYYRPRISEPRKDREAFGLPSDTHLYICPQTLFKFHPDFDTILGNILRADPVGRLILIEGKFPHWTELLKRRFARTLSDVLNRILWLPAQKDDDFINLLAVCDVMLDTPHFNGMNTSLEAFAVGTPVITLPTILQRGRHTLGMYKKMGIVDCIAGSPEDYVKIAVRIGTDPPYQRALRDRILAASSALYEDNRVIQEFERFFTEAVARTANGG